MNLEMIHIHARRNMRVLLWSVIVSLVMLVNQINDINMQADRMSHSSEDLVTRFSVIASITDGNVSNTEAMENRTGELSKVLGDILAMAEQNSAGVEEFNALAEEVEAQVENVAASAITLSDESTRLSSLIDTFRIRKVSPQELHAET